jgi:hypothetical protein
MDRNRFYCGGHQVSCCRFWWELGRKGFLEELKLKPRDERKGYQKVMGVTVQKNLSHMEL